MWWVLAALGATVDLNQASVDQLDALPGLGRAKAAAIVAHRQAHGPLRGPADLLTVSGIGPGTVAALGDRVRYGPQVLALAPPSVSATDAPLPAVPSAVSVDPNTASEAVLRALPGLDAPRVEALIADRARNGPFESCAELARVQGVGRATVAVLRGMCAIAAGDADR